MSVYDLASCVSKSTLKYLLVVTFGSMLLVYGVNLFIDASYMPLSNENACLSFSMESN